MLIANTDRSQPQDNTLILTTTMPARLLLVLTEFPPSFGGMQTHAVALCHWLHGRGYQIEVATYRLEDGPAAAQDYPFPVHRILSRVAYHANLKRLVQLARRTEAQLIYSSTVYYGDLSELTQLPVLCRSAGNDVLRPWIAWPFAIGSALLDLPWVEQQLYRRWKHWRWPERLEGLLLRERHAAMRQSARQMTRIFANSVFTKQLLTALPVPDERVVTLPGGVDSQFFTPGRTTRQGLNLSETDFFLTTACRLVDKKGLEILVEAVALVRERGLPVQLLIAGEGRKRSRIEQIIAEKQLGSAVHLLGYLPQDQLRDYLHASDLFVLSSIEVVDARTGLRDAETMGRALCEAAACGLPVVSTESGGIPSVVEHGVDGWLVPPGRVEELANAIEYLLKNRAVAQTLAGNARQRAEQQFDWRFLFREHEQAIQTLLASGSEFPR